MLTLKNFLLIGLMMTISSCALNYEIVSAVSEATDFEAYKSFQIVQNANGISEGSNLMLEHRVERAIQHELEGMGYIPSKQPDFEVYWSVQTDTKIAQGVYNPYRSEWNSPSATSVQEYKEGTIVIEIADVQKKETVWQGSAVGKLERDISISDSNIRKVVKELFIKYQKDTGIKKINAYAIK